MSLIALDTDRCSRIDLERAIETLIDRLDTLDGDADFEPTLGYVHPGYADEHEVEADFEPSLGWTIHGGFGQHDWHPAYQDLEAVDCR